MAIHSKTIAWKIPWTEEPGRLQSMGSQRVRHNWATSLAILIPKSLTFNKTSLIEIVIAMSSDVAGKILVRTIQGYLWEWSKCTHMKYLKLCLAHSVYPLRISFHHHHYHQHFHSYLQNWKQELGGSERPGIAFSIGTRSIRHGFPDNRGKISICPHLLVFQLCFQLIDLSSGDLVLFSKGKPSFIY